jgi:hypothetical protein
MRGAHRPVRKSRTDRLSDSLDLAPEPCVRGIGVHSGMPDHQIRELTMVGSIRRDNADQFFLVNDLTQ